MVLHREDAKEDSGPEKFALSSNPLGSHIHRINRKGWEKGNRWKCRCSSRSWRPHSFSQVCFITVVSGLSLPNCIQDHHVSLWWCVQWETEGESITGQPCSLALHAHSYSFAYLQYSLYSLFPHSGYSDTQHTHRGNEAVQVCSILCVQVSVFKRVVFHEVGRDKCHEGGPASCKEGSVQGGRADWISAVGAMKWWWYRLWCQQASSLFSEKECLSPSSPSFPLHPACFVLHVWR